MSDTIRTHGESTERLRRLELDEPLNVWVSEGSPSDLEEAVRTFARGQHSGAVTAVLWLSDWSAVERTMTRDRFAERLVFVATDVDRKRWGAVTAGDLYALARSRGEVQILIEPDPERAVVGSMQWLRPNDTLFVAWPDDDAAPGLAGLIAKGARWRGAWEVAEYGEFTSCPPGPGLYQEDRR